jgi:uncharacterized protein (TIRG00374 family)
MISRLIRGKGWSLAVRLLGIALVVVILLKVDLNRIGATLARAHVSLLLLGIVLNPVVQLVRSLRWRYIIRAQSMDISVKDALCVGYASFALAFLTPGRIGDLARGFHLIDRGNSFVKSFLSVVLDRILDASAIAIIGLLGLFFLGGVFEGKEIWFFLLLVSIPLVSFIMFKARFVRTAGYKALLRLLPVKGRVGLNSLVEELRCLTYGRNVILVLYTLLLVGSYFFQGWILTNSLGISIGYFSVAFAISLNAMLAFLPVSYMGIGTRDAAFVYVFWKLGLPAEEAIAFSVLILIAAIINVIAGYIIWAKNPGIIRIGRRRPTDLHEHAESQNSLKPE